MYSFQAAMNAKIDRGHDARQRERQHDPHQRPQPPAAVDRRRLLDLPGDRGEEGAQDPDGERQVEGGVGQDERGVRVDQAQLEELAVEADDQRRRREHLGDQHQEQERRAPGEAVARGVVGGRHGGQHHERVDARATTSERVSQL